MARHEAKKKLAKWQIALLVLLALVFLLAAAISGVLTHYLNKINRPEENPVYLEEEEYVSMVLAEEEDNVEFRAHIADLRSQLQLLSEMEQLRVENVL